MGLRRHHSEVNPTDPRRNKQKKIESLEQEVAKLQASLEGAQAEVKRLQGSLVNAQARTDLVK